MHPQGALVRGSRTTDYRCSVEPSCSNRDCWSLVAVVSPWFTFSVLVSTVVQLGRPLHFPPVSFLLANFHISWIEVNKCANYLEPPVMTNLSAVRARDVNMDPSWLTCWSTGAAIELQSRIVKWGGGGRGGVDFVVFLNFQRDRLVLGICWWARCAAELIRLLCALHHITGR